MKVLMIQRAERFSPNSVEKDRAILEAVGARLMVAGYQVDFVNEEQDYTPNRYDHIMTMGRLPETLEKLDELHAINASEGIANCARCQLEMIMLRTGIPMAPKDGDAGYWLKRGDAAAQSKDDVVFAANRADLEARIAEFKRRGIEAYTVSAHVEGDLVKFYGVHTTGFFRFYYPTDDGLTKFDDELRNGQAKHFAFDTTKLHRCAEILAEAVGVQVYGGDCIVKSDGSFCIIDFNDWPSFSRCREEAADAISKLI